MLGHWFGSVYRKVCSTFEITVLQPSQMNVARYSSGRTSDVLVTVPEIESNFPTDAVRNCRIREISGKL